MFRRKCLLVLETWEDWDELGGGRLEEKVFVSHWGWSPRGKEDHSRFPATELGTRLGDCTETLPSAYLYPGRSCPRVSMECLLELGFGTNQQVGG